MCFLICCCCSLSRILSIFLLPSLTLSFFAYIYSYIHHPISTTTTTTKQDITSEKIVQEALDMSSSGRTVVIIAHRCSTIKHVENIIVVENGAVAESGGHAILKASGGVYARLLQTYKDSVIDA